MLKRDFTKSNKDYFKNNKTILIAVAAFLLVGILIFLIFGMNGNFEINGYNEFSATVSEATLDNFGKHKSEIGRIVDSYNGKFDTVLVNGEGDDTQLIIRYHNNIKNEDAEIVNNLIAEELKVSVDNISKHIHVGASVKNTDYIFTAVSILLLIVVASIFAYARYNGASAMSVIIACVLGTIGFMSLGSILRLTVGLSYFAMLVILNMLIIYFAIDLFESMHNSSWLKSNDYATALEKGINSSKFRTTIINIVLLAIGLLLVLIAPITLKHVAINIMFMAVSVLAVTWYVVPFVWSVFITRCRNRGAKIKASNNQGKNK